MIPLDGWLPNFSAPGRLIWLIAIPLLVAAYLWASRRKNRRGMRFTNTSMLGAVVPKQSQWRRHLAVAFSLLSLVSLTGAWAKPVAQVDVPRERATIVVVLDVSQSMAANDIKPDRLTVAKNGAKDFVQSLPEKYNVALVAMSGNPSLVIPPTLDRAAMIRGIDSLQLRDSTAIGESIVVGLRALDMAPKDKADGDKPPPGAIVMLSDGTNTLGRPAEQGAQEAIQAKVKVYTIGYGTENGYVDLDGKREAVPVNQAQMERVAQMTGGSYFRAATPDQLKKVYENIGSSVGVEKAERETTAAWAGWGLGFAALAALAAISLAARWP
ncbi:VWA domain-containing protein [Enemella evansiae]|uniref:Magnesium chelatase n=1 Tax=Enemella evansiae TaxID=2016499 RepID=A0A255FW26_9ACTN|nr:VWA domain-containing protein [Enemella evansiae]PFG66659.1 Ca-activated chloride channel family protein [Propionibacteriaceae bacterium ES.041]OYN93485.1 magnesium chelatase [Enemella evansiae]OYN93772.1 magnesium chelatase [Enemella evansiae]OYO05849.1 magnesium chelatase [Enemella evansiae]OYO07865.1 magnesium chelatase [Enemella evansiae]